MGYPTYAYKLGFTQSGQPVFSQAGQTHETSAGRVGVGIPTVTSFQGQPGTGILWMADPDAGLRAWNAVPGPDGYLTTIPLPAVNGLNKFQRPAFGDARLYITDANGVLYCLGSPVNLPLNCTSVNFGSQALGSVTQQNVSCKTLVGITSVNGATTGDPHFVVMNTSLPIGPLAAGVTFSFPVTWNLQNQTLAATANASYGNITPGIKSTALSLSTTNAVAGYTTTLPISLTGVEVSNQAYLTVAPIAVSYSGIVILNNQTVPTASLPFVISNAGLSPLQILGYAYTNDPVGSTNMSFTNATTSNNVSSLGVGFTSPNLPPVGTVLQAGSSVSVDSDFDPVNGVGQYSSYLFVYSDGGTQYTVLTGSASTAPIANFSISSGEGGGWLPASNLLMDFGDVAPGSTSSREIRICNNGGSPLTIDKSKPPLGVFHLEDPTELEETQSINIGDCAYGTVLFIPPTEVENVPNIVYTNTWTLNTNDLNFGVHVVQIQGTLVDTVTGPLNSSNLPVYEYLGCYLDDAPSGRLLSYAPYANSSNTNGLCQTECYAGNYVFAGTEYMSEYVP